MGLGETIGPHSTPTNTWSSKEGGLNGEPMVSLPVNGLNTIEKSIPTVLNNLHDLGTTRIPYLEKTKLHSIKPLIGEN